MRNLGLTYMLTALFWLLAGMALGLWMGATNALQYRPLHITMMMLGFVLLAIYGAIFRLWPQLEMARFATLQFRFSTKGAFLMTIGTLNQVLGGSIVIDGIGSALAFGGAIVLVFLFLTNALDAT